MVSQYLKCNQEHVSHSAVQMCQPHRHTCTLCQPEPVWHCWDRGHTCKNQTHPSTATGPSSSGASLWRHMGYPSPDLWSGSPVKDIQKKTQTLIFWLTEVICTGTWFYRALHHSRVVQNRLGPVLEGHLVRSWALSLPSQSGCLSGSTSCHHRVRLFCCLYVRTWRKRSVGKSDCSNWILKPMCPLCHLQVFSSDYAVSALQSLMALVVMVTRLVLICYINIDNTEACAVMQWTCNNSLSSFYSRFRDMAELCLPPRCNILLVAHDAACYKMDALLAERHVINISVLMTVIVCRPAVMQQAKRWCHRQTDTSTLNSHVLNWIWIWFETTSRSGLIPSWKNGICAVDATWNQIQLGPKSNLRPQCEPGLI